MWGEVGNSKWNKAGIDDKNKTKLFIRQTLFNPMPNIKDVIHTS